MREYAKAHEPKLFARIEENPDFIRAILNIGIQCKNPRKDFAKFADVYPTIRYFFEDEYLEILRGGLPFKEGLSKEMLRAFFDDAIESIPFGTDESTWFEAVKQLGGRHGFAISNKDYKERPNDFVGSVSDCAEVLRVAVVGSNQSPNLHEILEILGEAKGRARFKAVRMSL